MTDVAPAMLEAIDERAVGKRVEPLARKRRSSGVAAQALQPAAIAGRDLHRVMDREAVERREALVRPRAGRARRESCSTPPTAGVSGHGRSGFNSGLRPQERVDPLPPPGAIPRARFRADPIEDPPGPRLEGRRERRLRGVEVPLPISGGAGWRAKARGSATEFNLSEREFDVLRALVDGLGYKQIASDLQISVDTVRSHIRNIYRKLQVHSGPEAVARALREGIV